MSFKVVLNQAGQPVAFGPNESGYVPGIPAGGSMVVQESAPTLAAPVPQTVTRFQALAALHLAGYLPAVEAIMAAPETPILAKLAWDNALSFERSSPTLASLAAVLGLTSQDLDDLFTAAAGIAA